MEFKSRKERRKAAKKNGVKFEPQYNGEQPYRGQSKAVLKIQINDEKYKEKRKSRKAI